MVQGGLLIDGEPVQQQSLSLVGGGECPQQQRQLRPPLRGGDGQEQRGEVLPRPTELLDENGCPLGGAMTPQVLFQRRGEVAPLVLRGIGKALGGDTVKPIGPSRDVAPGAATRAAATGRSIDRSDPRWRSDRHIAMKDLAALRADGRRVQNVLIPLRPALHAVSVTAPNERTVNTAWGLCGRPHREAAAPVIDVGLTVVGRTLAGMIVLGLVVILLCVMTLQVPSRIGVAIRSDPPPAPSVGQCGDMVGGEFVSAGCSQVHTVEVTQGWQGGDPSPGSLPTFAHCNEEARKYVGSAPSHSADAHPPGAWSMPLRYRALVISGPGPVSRQDWSWRACLVAPLGPAPWHGYLGSVRSVSAAGSAAAALRPCYLEQALPTTIVPCSSPHLGEIVGTRPAAPGSGAARGSSTSDLELSCAELATALTGAADPSFGGVLRVVVLPEPGAQLPDPLSADTGVYYTSEQRSEWLLCAIESAADRRLLDSVAGYAGRPLPLE